MIISTKKGHLTRTEKNAIKIMFKKNIYSAKINRKHYEIEKGNINQVTIRERERPTIGADLKPEGEVIFN